MVLTEEAQRKCPKVDKSYEGTVACEDTTGAVSSAGLLGGKVKVVWKKKGSSVESFVRTHKLGDRDKYELLRADGGNEWFPQKKLVC